MGGIVPIALIPARPNCVLCGHTSEASPNPMTAQVLWRCTRRATGRRGLPCGPTGILEGHSPFSSSSPQHVPRPGQAARAIPDDGRPAMRRALPLPCVPQTNRHDGLLPDDELPGQGFPYPLPSDRSFIDPPFPTETMVPEMPRSNPCRHRATSVTHPLRFFRNVSIPSAL